MPASRSSRRRWLSTLEDIPAQRSWSTRKGSGASLSSQITRNAQRRPSRSSSAITGRPLAEPRTGDPGRGGRPGLIPATCFVNRSRIRYAAKTKANEDRSLDEPGPRIQPLQEPYSRGRRHDARQVDAARVRRSSRCACSARSPSTNSCRAGCARSAPASSGRGRSSSRVLREVDDRPHLRVDRSRATSGECTRSPSRGRSDSTTSSCAPASTALPRTRAGTSVRERS